MVGSLRPRKSVNYSKSPAPGTPTWLKLPREDGEKDAADTGGAGTEKENAKPASAERKAKKADAQEGAGRPAKEQKQGKERHLLARKDEPDDVAAKVPAAKKGKGFANAVAEPSLVDEGPSTSLDNHKAKKREEGQAAKDAKGDQAKQKGKARKSAPAPAVAEEQPALKDNKRKSAPEKLSTKRALPEPSRDAQPAGKAAKKAKTSGAAEAPVIPEQPRAGTAAEAQPHRSADSWKTSSKASKASKGKEAQEQATSQPCKADSKVQPPVQQQVRDQPKHAEKKAEKPAAARAASKQQSLPQPSPQAPDSVAESDNFKKLQVCHSLKYRNTIIN